MLEPCCSYPATINKLNLQYIISTLFLYSVLILKYRILLGSYSVFIISFLYIHYFSLITAIVLNKFKNVEYR